MLLHYSDAIYPVLTVEMIPELVTSPKGPQAEGEVAWALYHAYWEADAIHLE